MVFVFSVSREGEAVARNCLPCNEALEYRLKYLKNTYILSSNQKKKKKCSESFVRLWEYLTFKNKTVIL